MKRPSRQCTLAIAFVCATVALCERAVAAPGDSAEQRPNILFIFADDWGWGDLSCHGHPEFKTPHLDQLAAEGSEFYQFTVGNPVCSPSRTAVMTGQYPARHHIHRHFSTIQNHIAAEMPDWLDPSVTMLPRLLQRSGYVTAHFGKWHLTNRDITDAPLPPAYGYDEYGVFNIRGPQIKATEPCEKAIEFIRKHKDQRFFVNLWLHETHTPHYPTQASLERFARLDPQQRVYAAVVADADQQVGNVLATLKDLGIADNTLVVFSSDNGPEVTGPAKRKRQNDNSTGVGRGTYYSVGSTGGLRGRKRSLYAGGVRVPFIVRWPGHVPAGRIDKSTIITAVDLLPTFCAVAKANLPEDYQSDGEEILPALLGKELTRKSPVFWQWRGPSHGANWPRLGVREGKWKLLMTENRSRLELYDVASDRGESKDLSRMHPEVAMRLADQALAWRASLPTEPPAIGLSKARKQRR